MNFFPFRLFTLSSRLNSSTRISCSKPFSFRKPVRQLPINPAAPVTTMEEDLVMLLLLILFIFKEGFNHAATIDSIYFEGRFNHASTIDSIAFLNAGRFSFLTETTTLLCDSPNQYASRRMDLSWEETKKPRFL